MSIHRSSCQPRKGRLKAFPQIETQARLGTHDFLKHLLIGQGVDQHSPQNDKEVLRTTIF